MCGILAHVSFTDQLQIAPARISELNDLMRHRGPDEGGVFAADLAALAMRRLSIIDVAHGGQPMASPDGRYVLVFNGEIYNYRSVRDELVSDGREFLTQSDTEVLLAAYQAWGSECVHRLEGMFAFAIWDNQEKELFVARDHLGIKPLYYTCDHRGVLLASELTPIVRSGFCATDLNLQAVCDYLSSWYICEPQTIFQNAHAFPPGHYGIVRDRQFHIHPYWQVPTDSARGVSFSQAREQLEALLTESVNAHMQADVPLGTFLSGGIDSGLITALARKARPDGSLAAFAIGFKEKSYDETVLAARTAQKLGVNLRIHRMEEITPDLLETIIGAFDEPLGNASYIPTYVLARAARQELKVVLTGDGGDELFGGYPTYQAPYYLSAWKRLPEWAQQALRQLAWKLPVSHRRISLDYRLKQLMVGVDSDYRRAHTVWRQVASLEAQKPLWRPAMWQRLDSHDPFRLFENHFNHAKALSVINQLMYVDLHTFLRNDHLRKVDRMSMAHGLEARVPFLDRRLVEFAVRLPSEYKVTPRQTKRILKSLAIQFLPPQVIWSGKKGLTVPIASWLSVELKDYARKRLQGGILGTLFRQEHIDQLLQEHWSRRRDHSRLLWALLTLQVWHDKHC